MVEQTTSKNIIAWLRVIQPSFTEALKEFGGKHDRGFEWYHRQKVFHGEFTGVGLCDKAVAVLEEGLRRKYPGLIETAPCSFSTNCMDPETLSGKDLAAHPHHNLHFRVHTETNWFILDPTYRQFQIRVNPFKMLIGVPAEAQDRLYSIRSTPVSIKPRSLYSQLRDFDEISFDDYQKLLEVFI